MKEMNRTLLKENAKKAMKENFWMMLLVVLVGTLLGAEWTGIGNINFSFNLRNVSIDSIGNDMEDILSLLEDKVNEQDEYGGFDYEYDDGMTDSENLDAFFQEFLDYFNINEENFWQTLLMGIGVLLIIIVILSVLIKCVQFLIGSFLCAPIGTGYRKYFMKNRQGNAVFLDLFSAFTSDKYMKIVKTMFSANIRIWGWSLLFYFPGVVKYYEYFFVSYIMAENPEISPERAREISKQMTDGYKWNMFVLSLSFIGWIALACVAIMILAVISCGLLAIPGMVLVYPVTAYVQATFAELYEERREYALMTGMATHNELTGF